MRKKVTRKVAKSKIATSQNKTSQIATSQSSKVATSQSKQVVKRKIGRPTKYRPEMLQVLHDYLEERKKSNQIPIREDFAISVGVLPDTLADWERANVGFSRAIKQLDSAQKTFLMQNALNGTKKEATSIFLLKANHGMMETSRQEITGKDGKDLNINITAFTGGNVTKQLPTVEGEIVE
jgi:hypothetical protein